MCMERRFDAHSFAGAVLVIRTVIASRISLTSGSASRFCRFTPAAHTPWLLLLSLPLLLS